MSLLIAPEVDNFLQNDDVAQATAYYQKHRIDLNYKDEEGFTLASLAALNNASKLFSYSASTLDDDFLNINHPIRIAAEEKNLDIVQLAFEYAQTHRSDFNFDLSQKILVQAIKHNLSDSVAQFLPRILSASAEDSKFNIVKKLLSSELSDKDALALSVLPQLNSLSMLSDSQDDIGSLAIQYNCPKVLLSLIDSGYEFSQFYDFDTLMSIAVDNQSFHCAAILLDSGISMTKEQIYSSIEYVAKTFDQEMLNLLRQDSFFATVANQSGDHNLLLSAIKAQNQPLIEWCLDKKVNVTREDDDGSNAIHLSVENMDSQNIERLKSMGSEVNKKDATGNNALLLAVANDDFDSVKALLKNETSHSVGINEKNHQDVDSMSLAIHRKNYEILTELLFKAPDLHFKDLRQLDAPELMEDDFLLDKSELEAAEFRLDGLMALHQLGYNFNLKNELGQNIINLYCRHNANVVNLINLLDVGANIEERADDGLNALEVCLAKGYHEKLDIILHKRKYDFEPERIVEVLSHNKFPAACVKVMFSHSEFSESPAAIEVLQHLVDKKQDIDDGLSKMPKNSLLPVLLYAMQKENFSATQQVCNHIEPIELRSNHKVLQALSDTLSPEFQKNMNSILQTTSNAKRTIK